MKQLFLKLVIVFAALVVLFTVKNVYIMYIKDDGARANDSSGRGTTRQ